jgi:hypothetical protein
MTLPCHKIHDDEEEHLFKTAPFAHQLETYLHSRDLTSYALFWEMGCGKTKVVIDTAAHLWRQGKITGVVVVAPPGVHRNWATEELPAHHPEDVPMVSHVWHASKAGTKRHAAAYDAFTQAPGLAYLCMTYDGICTGKGKAAASTFMRERPCLLVADESAYIKTPSAQRTKVMLGAARVARYRRALTGTPIANGPFDIYSQMRWLQENYWRPHGLATYGAFKARFGVFRALHLGARQVSKLVAYRDVESINTMIKPAASRKTKAEVLPHLPPKLYKRLSYEVTDEQRRIYEQLIEEMRAELRSGAEITAPLATVRLLRLQQVLCGYLPDGDHADKLHQIVEPEDNPRLLAFAQLAETIPHQAIVWCRFRQDVTLVCQQLEQLGLTWGRYDGECDQEQREETLRRFHAGEAQFFVANAQAIGTGVTLTEAKTVVYYSSSFNYADRLQSEDRAHRIGQDQAVLYIDLVAEDTVDERVLAALRNKDVMAARVTGDLLRTWIQ